MVRPEGASAAVPRSGMHRALHCAQNPVAQIAAESTGTVPAGDRLAELGEWLLLIYRVPSEPSNNRVSVWRELKRLGALYLQQCVCVLPAFPECEQSLTAVVKKIDTLGGSHNLFRVPNTGDSEATQLVEGFREMSAKEYGEIIEECRTKFVKEVEFERFRENFTYEEAEEIREDLEKIRRWLTRVVDRDWFDAGMRAQVEAELESCERLLEGFEEEVYRRVGADQGIVGSSKVRSALPPQGP
jgi:hypothetical protein